MALSNQCIPYTTPESKIKYLFFDQLLIFVKIEEYNFIIID